MAPLYIHPTIFEGKRERTKRERFHWKMSGNSPLFGLVQCDTSSRLVHTVVQKYDVSTPVAVIIRRSKLPMTVTVCKCHGGSYESVLYGVFGFFQFLLMVLVLD